MTNSKAGTSTPAGTEERPSGEGRAPEAADFFDGTRIREELARSERRFRFLFEKGADAMYVYRPDGTITDANLEACRSLGYARDELVGMDVADVIDDADQESTRAVRGLRPGQRMTGLLGRHRRKDGGTVPVEAQVTCLEWEEERVLLASARDVTERTRALESLTESNQVLNALIESAPVAVMMSDRNHRLFRWNPAAERILGWSEDEVLGRPNPCVPEEGRAFYQEAMDRVLAGTSFTGVEVTRQRKDGSPVRLRVWTAPLRDAEGRVTGSLGIVDDITERERLETQLRQAQKMEAVGQLAGGVAHDFNNYLTTILSLTSLAMMETEPGDPIREDLEEIRTAAEHSADLTRQLLAFGRRQVLRPEVLCLNEVLGDLERMLRRLFPETVEVELELAPDALLVQADPGQIHQVVLNLAINARDAMPAGGRFTIRTRKTPAPDGEEPGDGRWVEIELADTGTGMEPEVRERIFEPFFSTKPMGEGTGLGLPMAHGIVEQSGGTLRAESEPGSGSRFHVRLPEVDPGGRGAEGSSLPSAPTRSGTESDEGRPPRVLVVEDDPTVRRLVCRALSGAGIEVREAADGWTALEWLERDGGVDLILSDAVMPEMGALELGRALDEAEIPVPVLVMTGYAAELSEEHALPDNIRGVLEKPFGPGDVVRKVREALKR